MRNAAALLTGTFLSVNEIVKRMGFTESHFVRDFKKIYGVATRVEHGSFDPMVGQAGTSLRY